MRKTMAKKIGRRIKTRREREMEKKASSIALGVLGRSGLLLCDQRTGINTIHKFI